MFGTDFGFIFVMVTALAVFGWTIAAFVLLYLKVFGKRS